MPHKHAALMALYAEDAAETDKPWERWEYRGEGCQYWIQVQVTSPSWSKDNEYRRKEPKPERVRVNAYLDSSYGHVHLVGDGSQQDRQCAKLTYLTRITPDFGGHDD